jgi:NAD(P) transhydrogenase
MEQAMNASTPDEYDLIVIGSGPAGQKAAFAAAKNRARVALIERRQVIGGGCLHTGTIPSKTLREATLHLTGHRLHGVYGTSYRHKERITTEDLTFRVEDVVRKELDVLMSQMQRNGIDMYSGPAHFDSPHSVVVEESPRSSVQLRGKHFIIAVGTEPARPDHIPFTPNRIIDSDEILKLKDIPQSMTVVGGGVIGCEYASIFSTLHTEVTLVEQRPRILDFADHEIVDMLIYHMRREDVILRLGEAVSRVIIDDQDRVVTELESGKRIISDTLLFSIGRQGATVKLNLDAAGLTADKRGRLTVNESFQTEVEHIYACGDVIGFPSLASTSMEQGRLAACHALKVESQTLSGFYPYGIYTIPEISMVGQTEERLTHDNVPYEIGLARYGETSKGQILGDTNGMLKLLFHRETLDLLGVHIIGSRASEIVHIGQVVIDFGGKVDYFVNTVFNYPTLAEAYKVAAFDGMNKL